MFYVYMRHVNSGREEFVGIYNTAKEAVHKIAFCYEIDKSTANRDEYYYFMKQH